MISPMTSQAGDDPTISLRSTKHWHMNNAKTVKAARWKKLMSASRVRE